MPTVSQKIITLAIILMKKALITYQKNTCLIALKFSMPILRVSKKNGTELTFLLHCLKFKFDIICLTETRYTNIGIIDKEFPDFHIYLDNPTTAKGGVALLLRKDKFVQLTDLDLNNDINLKNKCKC